MISLNHRDARPIYEQVQDAFRRLIVTGVLAPDERLPSVRELASQLAINPNTIQRAYRELEVDGYIYSVPGKGSFAADRCAPDAARIEGLLGHLRETVEELCFLGCAESRVLEAAEEAYRACPGGENK